MDQDKDYYAILGVVPSVDAAVIHAVYRVLAKKYHPDTADAAHKDGSTFRLVQEAYGVLSAPEARARYDRLRKERDDRTGHYDEAAESAAGETSQHTVYDNEWIVVQDYEPRAAECERRLGALSPGLALTFRSVMLTGRDFRSAEEIANKLEAEFFERYFGDNPQIEAFARYLLSPHMVQRSGRQAARELNAVIRVLKNPSSVDELISKIRKKYNIQYSDWKFNNSIRIPDGPEGWRLVISEAAKSGWIFKSSLFGGKFIRGGHKIKVSTPKEAWIVLGLDG